MNERTRLEQLAVDAHEAGDDWATFWQQPCGRRCRAGAGLLRPRSVGSPAGRAGGFWRCGRPDGGRGFPPVAG